MGPAAQSPHGDQAAPLCGRTAPSAPDTPIQNAAPALKHHFIYDYGSNNHRQLSGQVHQKWGTLLQQHASRLDKYVSVMRDLSGKVVFLDQFGVLDFTEKTTRVGRPS